MSEDRAAVATTPSSARRGRRHSPDGGRPRRSFRAAAAPRGAGAWPPRPGPGARAAGSGQARVPQLHGVLVLARRRLALLRAPLVDQRGGVEDLLVGVAEPPQGARGGALAPISMLEGRPRRRRLPQAPEVRRQ